MKIDAALLAKQIKLAYDFMESLHGQAISLLKDVETQLSQSPEDLQCLKPGGYRFTTNQMSYGLERAQPTIADYYALYFRQYRERAKNTQLDQDIPPICFLKVVLRELGLEHPEVRFGVLTQITKNADRGDKWPNKFEDMINDITFRALVGPPPWANRKTVREEYKDSYISLVVNGQGVRLALLPNSEAIADKIVDPLLKIYRETT